MADYVSLTDMRRMKITVPHLDTQRRIAHILGTLDDKIELNRRTNETLEAIPRGWMAGTLGDMSDLNPESWSRHTRPDFIRYVDLSNTKWGRIEAVAHYNSDEAPSRAQRVLRIGDTIVGTVRPGSGSYALISSEGLTGSTGFAVLRPCSPMYTEFVYLAATSRDNIDLLSHPSRTRRSGSARR